jgi:hypothetical protein
MLLYVKSQDSSVGIATEQLAERHRFKYPVRPSGFSIFIRPGRLWGPSSFLEGKAAGTYS